MGREVPHVIDEHGDEVSHAKRYFHLTVFVKVGSQTLPANIAASSKLLLVSARHFIATQVTYVAVVSTSHGPVYPLKQEGMDGLDRQ